MLLPISIILFFTANLFGSLNEPKSILTDAIIKKYCTPTPTPPVPVISIAILKIAPTSIGVGSTFSYSITVENIGAVPLTDVIVTDPLPSQVHFLSATSSQGSVGFSSPNVTALLGTIPVNSAAMITVNVQAIATGTAINTATVTADNTPSRLSTATTNIVGD